MLLKCLIVVCGLLLVSSLYANVRSGWILPTCYQNVSVVAMNQWSVRTLDPANSIYENDTCSQKTTSDKSSSTQVLKWKRFTNSYKTRWQTHTSQVAHMFWNGKGSWKWDRFSDFFHFPWCQLLCCRPLLSWCFLSTLAICAFSHQKCQASEKMNKIRKIATSRKYRWLTLLTLPSC